MIHPIRTIVASIASLQTEDPLTGPAVELAERTGASLHLVHAFDLPDLGWDGNGSTRGLAGRRLDEHTAAVTARLEAQVARQTTRRRVVCHAVAGPPALVIQSTARDQRADLVVVGANRQWTLSRAILGTTAQRVLRGATAPVLVLRAGLPDPLRRVLLTTDLSELSGEVHTRGLRIVETLFGGAPPKLSSLLVISRDMNLPAPLSDDTVARLASTRLDTFLAERRGRSGQARGLVRFGEPASEIVAEANDGGYELVILGTHARSTVRNRVLGSVAEATVRSARSALLVIPPAGVGHAADAPGGRKFAPDDEHVRPADLPALTRPLRG